MRNVFGGPPPPIAFDGDFLSVEPRLTDPRIREWTEPHHVFRDPAVSPNGHVLLFLTGSNGIPGPQTFFLSVATRLGYTAVNLRYPNSWTVGDVCENSADPDCHGRVRQHLTEGIPSGELPSVLPHDAIASRFLSLLKWLTLHHEEFLGPRFLENGEVPWRRVVVAGHSQGGGHAAMLGKAHAVKRVVMLGSPADFNRVTNVPAPWFAEPGQTPAASHYGFVHALDRGCPRILDAWRELGMTAFGGLINVDREKPPYRNSHQLVSQAHVPRDKFHNSVVNDGATARTSEGTPAYVPVWRYLLDLEEPSV